MPLGFNKEMGVSFPSPPFYPSLIPLFPTDARNPSSLPGPVLAAWDRWDSRLAPGLMQCHGDCVSMRMGCGDSAVTELPENSHLQVTT